MRGYNVQQVMFNRDASLDQLIVFQLKLIIVGWVAFTNHFVYFHPGKISNYNRYRMDIFME